MAYPNGKPRRIVLLRPGQRDVFYAYHENAVLRGLRDMLNSRYRFVAVGRRDGRITDIVKRAGRTVYVERV